MDPYKYRPWWYWSNETTLLKYGLTIVNDRSYEDIFSCIKLHYKNRTVAFKLGSGELVLTSDIIEIWKHTTDIIY